MTTASSYGAATREPVYVGTRRIPNLWQRKLIDRRAGVRVRRPRGRTSDPRRLVAATKTDAITEARGLLTDRDRGELHVWPTAPTIETLRDEFVDSSRLARDRSGPRATPVRPKCAHLYRRHLETRFVPEFRSRRVDEITTADLRRWLDKLRATELAPNTQRGILTAANAMLRYAAKQEYIGISPAAGLDRDDRPSGIRKRQPRYLDRKQILALLGQLGDEYRPRGGDDVVRRIARIRGARGPVGATSTSIPGS